MADTSSKRARRARRPLIICVDDEEVVLSSLRRQLREIAPDFKVGLAKNGDDALKLFERAAEQNQPVPLLICDQLMPGMLGDELLAMVAERFPDTLQVMLTGQASPDAIGRAVNNGRLFRFLSKPWLLEDLQVSVRAAVKAHEQERLVEQQSKALKHAYERSLAFVPGHYLKLFGRERLEEVVRGDTCAMRVTVMFADIRAFTSTIEQLSPDESFSMVNEYSLATEPAIRENGGFIDHYRGDGTMALFPDDPVAAVRAGVEFSHALDEYNATRQARGQKPLDIGIGIHLGDVIAGVCGGEYTLQCVVIGDSVNTAARIEGLSSRYKTRLVISDTLRALIPDGTWTFRKLETLQVKGKDTVLTVWEVLDALPPDRRKARMRTLDAFQTGTHALEAGDIARALGAFASVLTQTPDDMGAKLLLGACYRALNEGRSSERLSTTRLTEKTW